jgi:hypothetical protein
MEIQPLPTPTTGDYGLEILSALGTILLIVVGFLTREYLRFRNQREADDRAFRDKQTEIQEQHYKDVAKSRDEFRANYEKHTNERLDGLGDSVKVFSGEIREILEAQQKQIAAIDKELYRLTHSGNSKKPPQEGE